MTDSECVQFLQWALPRLGKRWVGFRKVRRQICKRIGRRLKQLGLREICDYRVYLEGHPAEWSTLDSLCNITISRFYRDKFVFELLEREILPQMAGTLRRAGQSLLRCWSAGSACGEEAYTLKILWDLCLQPQFPALDVSVVATDVDGDVLERADSGCYGASSLKEIPADWLSQAFRYSDGLYCVRDRHRQNVSFLQEDIRSAMPEGRFHLILCRNVVLTYLDRYVQAETMQKVITKLHPGGMLLVGVHERLPEGFEGVEPLYEPQGIYRKTV